MKRLRLSGSQVYDLSSLAMHPNLHELELGTHQIKDLSVLGRFTTLRKLTLWEDSWDPTFTHQEIKDLRRELPNCMIAVLDTPDHWCP